MAEDIIVMRGLQKTFSTGWPWKRVRVLHGIDMTVARGEIFGYLGPNGAGKTTTLKLLVGLLRPTAGEVLVGGHPSRDLRARGMIGFLPENPNFYEYLTGREFLDLCGRLGNTGTGISRSRQEALLERVGLTRAAGVPLRKYSRGMLQRIGLAQAIVDDPPVLVLDEPMSGLDPIGRREIRDLILELKGEGKTIFFSSHILADVEMICDRVAFLGGGRLLKVGLLDELLGGGRETVEVSVAEAGADVQAHLAEMAEEVIRGPEATVFVLAGPERIAPFVRALGEAGLAPRSVNPRRVSLEELFLDVMERGSR